MSPLVLNFLAMALNLGLFVWQMERNRYGWAIVHGLCATVSALMVYALLGAAA